jgi:hypothetical protein
LDETINTWVRDKDKEAELGIGGADEGDVSAGASDDAGTGADASGAPSVFAGVSIDGLDIDGGLSRFGGDESYIETLRSYAEHTPPLIEKIREFGEADLPDVAVTVHGIKGSSYGVCANDVGKMAETLERAAKDGDHAFVLENMGGFIGKTESLLSDLSAFLGEADAANDRPTATEPDKELLGRLAAACASYDMDEIDEVMNELGKFRYEEGVDLIEWIRGRIEEGEFGEVAERLS